MSFVRRRMLTEAGEPLLLSPDPILAAKRYMRFRAKTSLPSERLSDSPLCTVPLPIYGYSTAPGGRQFPEVETSMMWHPLFWLPDYLAHSAPLALVPEIGEHDAEDVHAVRVALAMTLSGLYSVEHGGWLDILSTVGIDIDTPAGIARVAAWQAGERDEVLDGIDLSDYLEIDYDPEFFIAAAVSSVQMLRKVNWLRQATFLRDYMRALLGEDLGQGSFDDTLACLTTVASVSAIKLRHVAGCPEDPEVFWNRIHDETTLRTDLDAGQLVRGPASEALGWLTDVTTRFAGADAELETYGMTGAPEGPREVKAEAPQALPGRRRAPEAV